MKIILFVTTALLFTVLGCASKKAPVVESKEKTSSVGAAFIQEKPSWELEWERILREAKKEGRVSLTTGTDPETRAAVSKAFKEKFGLESEWTAARGPEMAEKVRRERAAGIYSFDVFVGAPDTGLTMFKPMGAFIPMAPLLLLPEILDAKSWFGNELPFVDGDKMLFKFKSYPSVDLMINTSLVKKDEVKAYRDLLNPKWKGKILIDDPTILGSGNRWAMIIGEYFSELGWDFQRELARQEPTLLRDRRLMAQWLALGKYSIYLGAKTEVQRMIDAGAPIAVVYPKEGTYGAAGHGSVAFYDKAPNPNAAQVFANWFLTREGQTVYSRARKKQSMRTDVPIDHLPPEQTREYILKVGGAFINPPDEEFSEIRKKRDSILQDIWSPLAGR